MRRIVIISLFLMLLLEPWARADVVVIVRREAEASGNYVRICDIARVEGPKDQALEVGQTVLGPTPPRGSAMEITRWDIETRLYEIGVASRIIFAGNDSVRVLGNGTPGRLALDGAPSLRELRPMQTAAWNRQGPNEIGARIGDAGTGVTDREAPSARGRKGADPLSETPLEARDRVGKAISRYLASRYNRPDLEVEAHLTGLSSVISGSAHEVEVDQALDGQVPGKAILRLRVKDRPEDQARLVTVDAETEVYGLAPVAGRQLARGAQLEPSDVVVKRVKMESGKGYFPPTPGSIAGRQLKRSFAADEPIIASETEMAPAVKQGEEIITDTWSTGWRITGKAKALAGGNVGDVIQVQDSVTKAKYKAKITAPGVVSVIVEKKNPFAA